MLVYNASIVWNEPICGYTSSSFHPHSHTVTQKTHTHTLIPFEDSKPTGLKVDIAKFTKIYPGRGKAHTGRKQPHKTPIFPYFCIPLWPWKLVCLNFFFAVPSSKSVRHGWKKAAQWRPVLGAQGQRRDGTHLQHLTQSTVWTMFTPRNTSNLISTSSRAHSVTSKQKRLT